MLESNLWQTSMRFATNFGYFDFYSTSYIFLIPQVYVFGNPAHSSEYGWGIVEMRSSQFRLTFRRVSLLDLGSLPIFGCSPSTGSGLAFSYHLPV